MHFVVRGGDEAAEALAAKTTFPLSGEGRRRVIVQYTGYRQTGEPFRSGGNATNHGRRQQ